MRVEWWWSRMMPKQLARKFWGGRGSWIQETGSSRQEQVMSPYLDKVSLRRQWAIQAITSRICGSESQGYIVVTCLGSPHHQVQGPIEWASHSLILAVEVQGSPG